LMGKLAASLVFLFGSVDRKTARERMSSWAQSSGEQEAAYLRRCQTEHKAAGLSGTVEKESVAVAIAIRGIYGDPLEVYSTNQRGRP